MSLGIVGGGHPTALVSNSGAVLNSGHISDLGIEQFGFFADKGEHPSEALAKPTFQTAPLFRFGIGVAKSKYDKIKSRGKKNTSNVKVRLSDVLNGQDILKWEGFKANKVGKNDIWALGYDGVDARKNLVVPYDSRKSLISIRMWGSAIEKLTGVRKALLQEFVIDKNFCESACEDFGCTNLDEDKLADAFLKDYNSRRYEEHYIKDFVKVTKLKRPIESVSGLIPFTKYCLTVCDDGTTSSLGQLQTQYPGYKVEFESRSGANSTYTMWRQTSAGAPASASFSNIVIPDCEDCPTGFTSVPEAKVFSITVKSGETVTLNTIPGHISNVKQSSTFTQDTYLVYTALTTTEAQVTTALGSTPALVSTVGIRRRLCTLTTPITVAWTACGTCNKAPKQWTITLADTLCGQTRLPELQAAYPDLVITELPKHEDSCARAYLTTNYSQCVEPGCYPDQYEFETPNAFENRIFWTEYVGAPLLDPDCTPEEPVDECKSVGLLFEGTTFIENFSKCVYGYYDYNANSTEPVFFEVSSYSLDWTGGVQCKTDYLPATKLQSATMIRGYGSAVREFERQTISKYEGYEWSYNQGHNDAFGITNWVADENKWYDEYRLTVRNQVHYNEVIGLQFGARDIQYSVFIEAGKGKQFEDMMNTYILSLDKGFKPVVL